MINCALAMFNIIPIPPLDGSKILMGLLPYNKDFMDVKNRAVWFHNINTFNYDRCCWCNNGCSSIFLTQLFMGKALFLGLFGGFFS